MKLIAAFSKAITQTTSAVITSYQLGIILFRLYRDHSFRGEPITNLRNRTPDRNDYKRYITQLDGLGIIGHDRSVIAHKEVYTIAGRSTLQPQEVACTIDPFGFVSHLSAMAYHGLTDRLPTTLYMTTPPSPTWNSFALERMHKDIDKPHFQDYLHAGLPRLRRIRTRVINRAPVSFHEAQHQGAFIALRDNTIRVASIGRTFLDMIRAPDLCGGISHVLEVYEEHAELYLNLITDEIERNGQPIDKVRAGYILDEVCGLANENKIINSWKRHTQRGGSRKLYAKNEYSNVYSETWCLSINPL